MKKLTYCQIQNCKKKDVAFINDSAASGSEELHCAKFIRAVSLDAMNWQITAKPSWLVGDGMYLIL